MASRIDTAKIGALINEFLRAEREKRRGEGQPLPDDLRTRYAAILEGHDALLKKVRVVFVKRLPDPQALNAELEDLGVALSFSGDYEGMTFVDTILLATDVLGVTGFEDIVRAPRQRADGTLLHELVHVVQYAALGVDPASAASIGQFTKWQIPDYLHLLGLAAPPITYEQVTFEDAARRTENEYKAGGNPDGVAIAYELMDAKGIPYTRLEALAV